MPPCQASTFTLDGVNITKQPERITLEHYVRAVRNEIINKPSIVTNVISAIMPPAGNTFGLKEYMLVKGKEEK
jgi:hypothetical protein